MHRNGAKVADSTALLTAIVGAVAGGALTY
jgi:hypothetical protein